MFKSNEKLTKNQRDTIIRKAKQFGINLKKDPHVSNLLTFRIEGNTKDIDNYEETTAYVNGELKFAPFSYSIDINNYGINKNTEFYVLYNILNDIEEFLDWLEKYQTTRIK